MTNVDPAHWFLPAETTSRSPHFTRGNAVVARIDGMAYMAALQGALETCDAELLIAGWRVSGQLRLNPRSPDGAKAGQTFAEAVTAAAKRGAQVKALLWNPPGFEAGPGPLKQAGPADNMGFARGILAAGGDAILDSRLPPNPLSSHHQKFIVATSKDPKQTVAFIGGIDVCDDRWDTPAHDIDGPWVAAGRLAGWHDVQAQVQGPAVAQLWQAFRTRWNDPRPPNHHPLCEEFRGRTRMHDAAPGSDASQAGTPATMAVQVHQTLPAGVFPEKGGAGETTIAQAHAQAIDRAEHYIYIEDQYVWPCALVDGVEAALRRGVHVLMVVARDDTPPIPPLAHISNRLRHEVVERLRKAGDERFQIFHIERVQGKLAGQQIYVHAKLMIVDDCYISIGSANFNGRSLTNDTEIEIGIVDEQTMPITIAGVPEQNVCRFAHELRKSLWAEHFQQPVDKLEDPIAALAWLWPAASPAQGQRAHPHHVKIGPLDIDPIAEYITTLVVNKLHPFPCIKLPAVLSERAAVKLAVDIVLRGPQCGLLLKALEELENPDLNPAVAAAGQPITATWRELWARRAACAVSFMGRHTPVNEADLKDQVYVETRNGVQIFRLSDGRYHVISHFAVPSLESARNAAVAVSGDAG